MSEIHKALLDLQKAAPKVQKDAINPHFGNRYVTLQTLLDKILPMLSDRGIVLLQEPHNIYNVASLRTTLFMPETGEQISSEMPLATPADNPQKQGSAITYARRYALMSILGLVADEDDDGNLAAPAAPTRAASTSTEPANKPLF